MTQIVCPLCKKFNSYDNFSVAEEADIIAVEVRGLGRGKGTEVTDRYSILDPENPAVEQIKDRILTLVKVLAENGCLNVDEVLSSLNIETADHKEISKLENEVEALEAEQEETHDTLCTLTQRITTFLEEEYEYDIDLKEEPVKAIKERVDALLDDYEGTCDIIREVNSQIEETLGEEYEFDEDEYLEQSLKTHMNALIEEYESMEAEEEEEEHE